eukprot:TRINITY_DN19_c0_g1_i5.p1 TRINITY_DN19_c0_g1~~TRINITY_DN19_c0_g1_i5.p1  ORF type:complete len:931 (+),score=175.89 TRINITY_DN19_c0_g1_i5:289-2793(+)
MTPGCLPGYSGDYNGWDFCYRDGKDCNGVLHGPAELDICGVCNGDGTTCLDCLGIQNGVASFDVCGVCEGDGASCLDCSGVPYGPARVDLCGECDGDNTACADCNGVPNGPSQLDLCGVCDGDNTACQDCNGVPNGGDTIDTCGVCGGNNACLDCNGVIDGDSVEDRCGVCDGDGTSCINAIPLLYFGASGCTAENPCGECEGDCDSDADCDAGLRCFKRDNDESIPGCAAGGEGDKHGHDYCYFADPLENEQTYVDDLSGWTILPNNGLEVTNNLYDCGDYGTIVGGHDIIAGGKIFKTYSLPSTACHVRVQMDYVKIDSWDDEMAWITINDETLWSDRFGMQTGPRNTCGRNDYDDNKVTVDVEATIEGMTFTLAAHSDLEQTAWDESFGITNIQIIPSCPVILQSQGTYVDDFSQGWNVPTSTCGSYGTILGGYNVIAAGEISKMYNLPYTGCSVRVQLDFIKIDTWNDETAYVTIDGEEVWRRTFAFNDGLGNECGDPSFSEDSVSIDVERIIDDMTFTLSAVAELSSDPDNESFGISNVRITPNCPGLALDNIGNNRCSADSPCEQCQGDCDRDSDCADGLRCFFRDSSAKYVPGCHRGGDADIHTHDFCYRPDEDCLGVPHGSAEFASDGISCMTNSPSLSPSSTVPSESPTANPSKVPTSTLPTKVPSVSPSSDSPSRGPVSSSPSVAPSLSPSSYPTTDEPTKFPTPLCEDDDEAAIAFTAPFGLSIQGCSDSKLHVHCGQPTIAVLCPESCNLCPKDCTVLADDDQNMILIAANVGYTISGCSDVDHVCHYTVAAENCEQSCCNASSVSNTDNGNKDLYDRLGGL